MKQERVDFFFLFVASNAYMALLFDTKIMSMRS